MNNAEKGKLLVISGPSGAGKSTVIGKLMELREDVCFSVSVTTRPARPNEEDGKDYFFVTPQRFQELAEGGFLLEHAEYVGNRYGTRAAMSRAACWRARASCWISRSRALPRCSATARTP